MPINQDDDLVVVDTTERTIEYADVQVGDVLRVRVEGPGLIRYESGVVTRVCRRGEPRERHFLLRRPSDITVRVGLILEEGEGERFIRLLERHLRLPSAYGTVIVIGNERWMRVGQLRRDASPPWSTPENQLWVSASGVVATDREFIQLLRGTPWRIERAAGDITEEV